MRSAGFEHSLTFAFRASGYASQFYGPLDTTRLTSLSRDFNFATTSFQDLS